MSASPASPYLDVEDLSRECTQIIDKHFRRLRYAWVWPHSRATLTMFEDRFQLDFPDSRTSIECAIDPDVVASVILEHVAVLDSRLLMWGKMPPAHFLDLLEAMKGCGFAVVHCHENHAILRLPKENTMDMSEDRRKERKGQRESLRERETELNGLVASGRKEEFFRQIKPLLDPLRSYIKRRLRVAYAEGEIRSELYTSGDILDQALLRAYERFTEKPKDLTLDQWLYRVVNDVLEDYLRKRKPFEKRRRSLEDLRVKELRTLDEKVTADAEGEVWLPEELDDSEYYPAQFTAPAETQTPEEQLEKKEELQRIVRALARVPASEYAAFELYAVEGLAKEDVAKILNISADEVPRMAERVRKRVLQQLAAEAERKAS